MILQWVEGMENNFECEVITKAYKFKVTKSRLRGKALTWLNHLQEERVKEGKHPIENWQEIVNKIKEAYLPKDFEIQMHKKRLNLKQRDMDVANYIEEFHKLSLRSKIKEEESVKVARYLNGLKWAIAEEMNLFTPTTILGFQQMAQKVEERLRRR